MRFTAIYDTGISNNNAREVTAFHTWKDNHKVEDLSHEARSGFLRDALKYKHVTISRDGVVMANDMTPLYTNGEETINKIVTESGTIFWHRDFITRAQYMADASRLHRAYHAQFVTGVTRNSVATSIGIDRLLKSEDKHLNDIPLEAWDALHVYPDRTMMVRAGESWTMATLVCIAKEAARQLMDEARAEA